MNTIRDFVKHSLKLFYVAQQVKMADDPSNGDTNPAIKIVNDGKVYVTGVGGYTGDNLSLSNSLQTIITTANTSIGTLDSSIRIIDTSIKKLDSSIKSADASIKSINASIGGIKSSISNLNDALDGKAEINDLEISNDYVFSSLKIINLNNTNISGSLLNENNAFILLANREEGDLYYLNINHFADYVLNDPEGQLTFSELYNILSDNPNLQYWKDILYLNDDRHINVVNKLLLNQDIIAVLEAHKVLIKIENSRMYIANNLHIGYIYVLKLLDDSDISKWIPCCTTYSYDIEHNLMDIQIYQALKYIWWEESEHQMIWEG